VPVCGVEGAGDDCAMGVEGRAAAAIVHEPGQACVPPSYLYWSQNDGQGKGYARTCYKL
jgi:hypothetical protein